LGTPWNACSIQLQIDNTNGRRERLAGRLSVGFIGLSLGGHVELPIAIRPSGQWKETAWLGKRTGDSNDQSPYKK
jgi:hypothetical protein